MSLRKGGKRRWELSEKWKVNRIVSSEKWIVKSSEKWIVKSQWTSSDPQSVLNIYIKKGSTLKLNPSVL
jgi:hypothetical protein